MEHLSSQVGVVSGHVSLHQGFKLHAVGPNLPLVLLLYLKVAIIPDMLKATVCIEK